MSTEVKIQFDLISLHRERTLTKELKEDDKDGFLVVVVVEKPKKLLQQNKKKKSTHQSQRNLKEGQPLITKVYKLRQIFIMSRKTEIQSQRVALDLISTILFPLCTLFLSNFVYILLPNATVAEYFFYYAQHRRP